jgi:myo-inositol catabolism protein IolC
MQSIFCRSGLANCARRLRVLASASAWHRRCHCFPVIAVGRATFWEPLVQYRANRVARETAVAQIAAAFRAWVDLFESEKPAIMTSGSVAM